MESIIVPLDLQWDWKLEPVSSPTSQADDPITSITDTKCSWSNDTISDLLNNYRIEFIDQKNDGVNWVSFVSDSKGHKDIQDTYISIPNAELTPPQSPPEFAAITPCDPTSFIDTPTESLGSELPLQKQDLIYVNEIANPASPAIGLNSFGNFSAVADNKLPIAADSLQLVPTASPACAIPVQPLDVVQTPAPLANLNFNFSIWNESNGSSCSEDEIQRNASVVDCILNNRLSELYDSSDATQSTDLESFYLPSSPSSSPLPSSSVASPSSTYDLDNSDDLLRKESKAKNRRMRPYGRNMEERKLRKKEQNKNAATRYRLKKKIETQIEVQEEQELTQRNEELNKALAGHRQEAKYLRDLLQEFLQSSD